MKIPISLGCGWVMEDTWTDDDGRRVTDYDVIWPRERLCLGHGGHM